MSDYRLPSSPAPFGSFVKARDSAENSMKLAAFKALKDTMKTYLRCQEEAISVNGMNHATLLQMITNRGLWDDYEQFVAAAKRRGWKKAALQRDVDYEYGAADKCTKLRNILKEETRKRREAEIEVEHLRQEVIDTRREADDASEELATAKQQSVAAQRQMQKEKESVVHYKYLWECSLDRQTEKVMKWESLRSQSPFRSLFDDIDSEAETVILTDNDDECLSDETEMDADDAVTPSLKKSISRPDAPARKKKSSRVYFRPRRQPVARKLIFTEEFKDAVEEEFKEEEEPLSPVIVKETLKIRVCSSQKKDEVGNSFVPFSQHIRKCRMYLKNSKGIVQRRCKNRPIKEYMGFCSLHFGKLPTEWRTEIMLSPPPLPGSRNF